MELMRHSDLKLTVKVYTDIPQLPLVKEAALLQSFSVPRNQPTVDTQLSTHAGVVSGHDESAVVAGGDSEAISQVTHLFVFGHKKAPSVTTGRYPKMERAKRLELIAGKPEPSEHIIVANSANTTDTQLSTHAGNELAEIISAWPSLSPEVRAAVLTLVRVAIPSGERD